MDRMKLLFAVDSLSFLQQTEPVLKSIGIDYTILHPARLVCRQVLSPSDIVLLETGDDAAKLAQIVYELYKNAAVPGFSPGIIGIASAETIERNPSLAFWLIDGGAALICLLTPDTVINELPAIIKRLNRFLEEERDSILGQSG